MTAHHRPENPEAAGLTVRIAAIDDLIVEQEHYLALLRMRRERMDRDLVLLKRHAGNGSRLIKRALPDG